MSDVPAQSRALRRTLVAGVAGFIIGFTSAYCLLAYVIVRYAWPESGWWALPDFLGIVQFAFVAGLVTASAAAWIFGFGGGWGGPCVADRRGLEQYGRRWRAAHPRQNRMMRHLRRHGPTVLFVQLLLIPVTLWLWTRPWRPRPDMAPPADVAFIHVSLCLLIAMVTQGVSEVAAYFKPRGRLAVRMELYTMLMAAWPTLFLIALFGGELVGRMLAM